MDLDRGSWTVVRAYVRPARRRSGGRSMSDLGLDLSAVALARGLKLVGAEAITTYREDGQTADGAAPEPSEEQRQIAVWRHPMRDEILALLPRRSAHWIAGLPRSG
jgi:hypothetical protein